MFKKTKDEILFKCYLNKKDVHIFKLKREMCTYYVVKGTIIEEYGIELGNNFTIKYKDSDGDFITIRKDKDLSIAINSSSSSVVKLYLETVDTLKVSTKSM